ncbi:hypothetical protein DFJ63DRAFT_335190 [Scheffersomyces coipomensis]|uniref:uncharacterized protein n=1 Tax=Scheffersomyces coipomensis TaxID=1788519 RepID=UPI00315D1275
METIELELGQFHQSLPLPSASPLPPPSPLRLKSGFSLDLNIQKSDDISQDELELARVRHLTYNDIDSEIDDIDNSLDLFEQDLSIISTPMSCSTSNSSISSLNNSNNSKYIPLNAIDFIFDSFFIHEHKIQALNPAMVNDSPLHPTFITRSNSECTTTSHSTISSRKGSTSSSIFSNRIDDDYVHDDDDDDDESPFNKYVDLDHRCLSPLPVPPSSSDSVFTDDSNDTRSETSSNPINSRLQELKQNLDILREVDTPTKPEKPTESKVDFSTPRKTRSGRQLSFTLADTDDILIETPTTGASKYATIANSNIRSTIETPPVTPTNTNKSGNKPTINTPKRTTKPIKSEYGATINSPVTRSRTAAFERVIAESIKDSLRVSPRPASPPTHVIVSPVASVSAAAPVSPPVIVKKTKSFSFVHKVRQAEKVIPKLKPNNRVRLLLPVEAINECEVFSIPQTSFVDALLSNPMKRKRVSIPSLSDHPFISNLSLVPKPWIDLNSDRSESKPPRSNVKKYADVTVKKKRGIEVDKSDDELLVSFKFKRKKEKEIYRRYVNNKIKKNKLKKEIPSDKVFEQEDEIEMNLKEILRSSDPINKTSKPFKLPDPFTKAFYDLTKTRIIPLAVRKKDQRYLLKRGRTNFYEHRKPKNITKPDRVPLPKIFPGSSELDNITTTSRKKNNSVPEEIPKLESDYDDDDEEDEGNFDDDDIRSLTKFQSDRYYSRLNIFELSRIIGLHKYDIALTKEVEINVLELFKNYCNFKLGYQTWIRGTTKEYRSKLIERLFDLSQPFYPELTRFELEVIVRRGAYSLMQTRLRKERRLHG